MGRKLIVFSAGVFIFCLFAACLLWYGKGGWKKGMAEEGGAAAYGSVLQNVGKLGESEAEQEERQRAGQEEVQEIGQSQWAGRERVAGDGVQDSPMGRNLSSKGCYLLEEGGCLFAARYGFYAGASLYGWRDVPEGESYNIYRLKNHVWKVFVSHPPESVNNERITEHHYRDKTYVGNLVSYDGFLYYCLRYDDGSDDLCYLYRVPVQGGEAEELAWVYDTFCIYNGKIYYMALDGEEYVYWEMEPDGAGRREICRRKEDWLHHLFTVGGGCLYLEEDTGDGITGVDLKTGGRKYYSISGLNVKRLSYENGYLYLWVPSESLYFLGSILRMDVVSDEKEYLADCVDEAWLENGFLYYIWKDYSTEVSKCGLGVLDLETKQLSTEVLLEEEKANMETIYLAAMGGDLLVGEFVRRRGVRDADIYFKCRAGTLQLGKLERQEVEWQ